MPKSAATIYEIREYAREKGEKVTLITAKTPIDCSIGGIPRIIGPVEYVGQAQGAAKNPAGQTMPIPFAFPIEAENIEDAFGNFNTAKQAAWPEAVEQFQQAMRQQASRIRVARSVDTAAQKMVRGGNGQGIKIAR